MRIIAGSKRGMKLLAPKGMATRPITDRVKESLFSILVNRYDAIEQSLVADLFCGTGSLGLEALSRGAQSAIFIDRDSRTTAILEKNIARANFVAESKVIRANAFKIGAPTPASGEKCDLVFVDPPYPRSEDTTEKSQLGRLLTLLNEQIAPDGIAVVRTHETTALLDKYDQLQIIERRTWGTMAVAIMGFGD